jgi:methylaspartate mutase sigma subunit
MRTQAQGDACAPMPARGRPVGARGRPVAARDQRVAAREQPVAAQAPSAPPPAADGLSVVVTSVASDSHTWNLVFLQLVLEELGHRVVNLGACVPEEFLVTECLRVRPDLLVVSSVNGHGFGDGMRLIGRIRARQELATTPVVIGGKLGIAGPRGRECHDQLLSAGFDAVFEDGAGLTAFRSFARELTAGVSS